MAPRETANNVYAKFWGDKQRALWYVVVFSRVVNCHRGALSRAKRPQRSTLGKKIQLPTHPIKFGYDVSFTKQTGDFGKPII